MALILDAVFAFILFKIFGESALWVLGITCTVTFLRMSGRVSFLLDILEQTILIMATEENNHEHN